MKAIRCLTLLFLLQAMALHINAADKCHFSAGLRDSHYIYGEVSPTQNLHIILEHSLFSGNFGYQRIALKAGYHFFPVKLFEASAYAGAATTWNGDYQWFFASAKAEINWKIINLNATINPLYDTGAGFSLCWQAGLKIGITKHIGIITAYSTIPEYRISEHRIRGGFEFKVKNLSASPEISLGMTPGDVGRNLRVLASVRYDF